MASPAQVTANIANAQFSSGPRTETGKATSSQNSLKHGLTAKTVLLPGEDEAVYRIMCQRMFAEFKPGGEQERILLQIACDTQWRIQRCPRIEATILDADTLDLNALDTLSKHETRLNKIYNGTLRQIRDLKDARLVAEKELLVEAIRLRRADKIKGRPTNLEEFGFVFSLEQVDAAIRREDALAQADITIRKGSFGLAAPGK